MCRIAGILNKNFTVDSLSGMVDAMCNSLQHGGPDDSGLFTDCSESLVLGNRRLALQDLSAEGHQPMEYQNRYTITYNGELYNFPVLKKELQHLGYTFKNETDTEVILAAFAEWNTQAFSRFNGMFAFALWDATEKLLYLVRDVAGIKPLYYSTINGGLCFASEIRAFKHIPYLQEENSNWPVYLMAYGHIPEPVTTLAGVKPLRKGFFIKYHSTTNHCSMQSFAHFTYSTTISDRKEVTANLQQLVKDAVERHLIADAEIGVFLSGGLDSSILTTVASSIRKSKLNTLSLYFKEKAFSEKKYQDLILDKITCNSWQHLLTEEEFHKNLQVIIQHMDMPGCDGINTWFISKYAKAKGLKAVLSGVGGDELFGGYPSTTRMKYTAAMQVLSTVGINKRSRSNIKQINRMSYLNLGGIKGAYLFLRGHYNPHEIAIQLGATEKDIWNILTELPVFNSLDELSSENQASWMEFNMYMQNQLLRDSDVMGMAHGVEIRVPFLDQEVVRYALSIHPSVKYTGSYKKQLLIDTFKDIIPADIWKRPKMGFSFPFTEWLGTNEYVESVFQQSDPTTQKRYQKFKNGKMHWSQLLSLLLLKVKN